MINKTSQPLFSRNMNAVISAQFFSAFGDNALLFATLALMSQRLYPDWSQPIIQMAFVAAYILLAPFVGQLADGFSKSRIMMLANCAKLLGALLISVGFEPIVGYSLVGVGAAIYSPAKYGILGELTAGDYLVKANGIMEASTIAAILIGSVAGGVLADWNVSITLWMCAAVYALAIIANGYITHQIVARPMTTWNLKSVSHGFFYSCKTLWKNSEARFSIIGTSLFWGAGVTVRFLLILWVPVALGISTNAMPTLLNAMVAIGIVFGAGAAAKWISLDKARRCLPAGMLIGLVIVLFSLQHALWSSYLLLFVVGVAGGFFIVPLNALLQERGKQTVGAGNAIAVQNLGENSVMLLMLGSYALAIKLGVPVVTAGVGFGVILAFSIGSLWFWHTIRRV